MTRNPYVTIPRQRVLQHIAENPGVHCAGIARALGMGRGIYPIITRLHRRGLVEYVACATARNGVGLAVTAAGRILDLGEESET
jgi:DNA-binding MarR family transcriptional regulator